VPTATSVSSSNEGAGPVGGPVTYTATVAPVAPGIGTPTGTVSFADSHGQISDCAARPLNEGSPDTATCATQLPAQQGSDEITATYGADTSYAGSSGSTGEIVGLHITTTAPLPEVTPNVPYSYQLEAADGLAPYKWKKVAGKLPLGLKLSNTGLLSGKLGLKKYPGGASFPITVEVLDATKKVHQTATESFVVNVS
jgi:hypothetical protein